MPKLYALKVNHLFYDVEYFTSISSTSTYLKNKKELREGMTVVAAKQTKGRGRDGKKFYSPSGGLYFSFVLKPDEKIISYITPLVGVACREAISQLGGDDVRIKWVNDIYLDDKKVCGILAETKIIGEDKFVIIGVGINTAKPRFGFNKKIRDIAGIVCSDVPNENLNTQILNIVEKYYKKFNKAQLLDKYRQFSNVEGRSVIIKSTGEKGKVKGIDDEFRLVATLPGGTEKTLLSGEIEFTD